MGGDELRERELGDDFGQEGIWDILAVSDLFGGGSRTLWSAGQIQNDPDAIIGPPADLH
jgi:hypothetical protein